MDVRDSRAKHFYRALLNGGFCVGVAKTLTAPLERAKLILQTQSLHVAKPQYSGLAEYFSLVAKKEGLRAFWKGNTANLLKIIPSTFSNFAFHHKIRRKLIGDAEYSGWRSFLGECAVGGCSGSLALLLTYPLDLTRTRLAADFSGKEYLGVMDCIGKTVKDTGIKGLYKGLLVSAGGLVPFLALSMAAHEHLLGYLHNESNSDSSVYRIAEFLGAGSLAGVAALTVMYPLDTVRRRLQVSGARGYYLGYSGALSCLVLTARVDGFFALYRGLLVGIVKKVPTITIQLALYGWIRKYSKVAL